MIISKQIWEWSEDRGMDCLLILELAATNDHYQTEVGVVRGLGNGLTVDIGIGSD